MLKPSKTVRHQPSGGWVALLCAAAITLAMPAQADMEHDYKLGREAFMTDNMLDAMTLLSRAAGAGHVEAMVLYAEILDRAEDDVTAIKWYRKAAEAGSAAAMTGLGDMHTRGEGVARSVPTAVEWYQKAADLDYPPAMYALYRAHRNGEGLRVDDEKAFQWLNKAAEKRFIPAMKELANVYRVGLLDLEPDAEEAARWDQEVKAAGEAAAQEKK